MSCHQDPICTSCLSILYCTVNIQRGFISCKIFNFKCFSYHSLHSSTSSRTVSLTCLEKYRTIKLDPHLNILMHKQATHTSLFCGVEVLPLCDTPYCTGTVIWRWSMYLISPNIKTLSVLTVFICPKLTFPVTWLLSTSCVATEAQWMPCESSRSSSQEYPKRKESAECQHNKKKTGIRSIPVGTWSLRLPDRGVLSAISLVWIARHHQQGDLTSASAPVRLCYITGPKGHQVGKDPFWKPEQLLLGLRCLNRWNTGKCQLCICSSSVRL